MTDVAIYCENISLWRVFDVLLKSINALKAEKEAHIHIYYINSKFLAQHLSITLLRFFNIEISKLDFKLRDIRDQNDELVRIRIPRQDLLEVQSEILNSDRYLALYHSSWKQGRIESYVNKGIIDNSILHEGSASHTIFIISVVNWDMHKRGIKDAILAVDSIPWSDVYKTYAEKYSIKLISLRNIKLPRFNKLILHRFIRNIPYLYAKLKNVKYKKLPPYQRKNNNASCQLYVDGRGDINLESNGQHSDFFWHINSEFPAGNILYQHHSVQEKDYLQGHGIVSTNGEVILGSRQSLCYKKPMLNGISKYKLESRIIKSILNTYDLDRYYWGSFFNTYNVRVYLTWYKYYNNHIAISDAINDVGGISAVWQMAYDGFPCAECEINADLVFSFSNFSHQIENKLNSKFQYNIITGYPKDYVGLHVKQEALNLRKKLQDNGAEKIVFVIDENSIDDDRWHTGHQLQRENYSFILEKLLVTPWLGAVFKPKAAKTLRHRLGDVAKLLEDVEKTGRCYVYEESGRHTTSAPPVLAGLSADVCIHGHLSSGTAALECVLEGLPTLLIDREGCPNSQLTQLPVGKVIFKDWPEAIDAVMEYFKDSDKIPGFGDWSSIIDELDPFRDGKAAYRMGSYLHWLIQGFESGLDRETIMAETAERYRKQWGQDKILSL